MSLPYFPFFLYKNESLLQKAQEKKIQKINKNVKCTNAEREGDGDVRRQNQFFF